MPHISQGEQIVYLAIKAETHHHVQLSVLTIASLPCIVFFILCLLQFLCSTFLVISTLHHTTVSRLHRWGCSSTEQVFQKSAALCMWLELCSWLTCTLMEPLLNQFSSQYDNPFLQYTFYISIILILTLDTPDPVPPASHVHNLFP